MKKRRIRKKRVVILILCLILVIGLFIWPYLVVNIKLIGNRKILLNYGDEYSEPGYRATMFGKNIKNKIKVSNNIKEDIGNYKVEYSYKILFYTVKKVRKVEVKDIEEPNIELKEGNTTQIVLGENFIEPGFTANDNKDGDITDKVIVSGDVDTSKLGEYQLIYEVTDSSNNESKKIRTVKVVRKNPKSMSIDEYSLSGWYEDNMLTETEDCGNSYFDKITMVGDSNIMHMYQEGYLKGIRAWAIPCLHADSMLNDKLNLYGLGKKMNLLDATLEYKPEILMINFGSFSTAWIGEDAFISSANTLIEKIKEISPYTKIVLVSIYPILKDSPNINDFSQETINRYNFMILEMANKYNLKYLDVQEVLKDETGYGDPKVYLSDGYHINSYGHELVKKYIKNHAIEEE